MSWVLFNIVTNPDVEAKVVAELEQQGFLASPPRPQPRTLEYDDIPKLPYLAAVVNETMRILPVCPSRVVKQIVTQHCWEMMMMVVMVMVRILVIWC
jgi:cytochrome P450